MLGTTRRRAACGIAAAHTVTIGTRTTRFDPDVGATRGGIVMFTSRHQNFLRSGQPVNCASGRVVIKA